jgi:rhodanese-related sulfurtransferase
MKKQLFFISLLLLLLLSSPVVTGCDYITGVSTEGPTSSKQQQIVNVSAVEAFSLIQTNSDNPDFIIIDVRTSAEYDSGHIENAVLVDYNSANFREEISKYDRDKKYLIYCRTGRRSAGARDIMEELGFSYIYHMDGGITEWVAEGFPVVK